MKKTLIELYTSLLNSVGMVADNQGFISTLTPGSDTPKPWTIDGRRGVLPLPEQLTQHDWSGRYGFNPLKQNVVGGESKIMEKFRERMNANSDFILGMLLIDLAQLGVKKEQHKDLTPEQAQYLGPFSDSDEKFIKLLADLTATKRLLKKNCEFIRFSVIKGRVWQGQKRSRVAVAHFPLYEALPKDNKPITIGNFKLRIADVKMLRNMYEFLFPGIREPGYYEVGSDSKMGPSIEALMNLYAKFVDVINTAVTLLEPVIGTSNALFIVNDWRDDMADPTPYWDEVRQIPNLEGNAPSERVMAAAAPARIGDSPIAGATRTVVGAEQTPVITANMVQPVTQQPTVTINHAHQQEQVVQQEGQPQPRFKLGVKPPVVQQATHQLTDQQAQQVSIGYQRHNPVSNPVPPTPPVGTQLAAQQQQYAQPHFPQPQAQAQQQVQAMKLPDSARVINGAVYIPVEGQGVSAMPVGAVLVDGKVYIPIAGGAPQGNVMMPGGNVLPGQQGRFGMQQPITDPAQVPGLSAEEIQMYRNNPVMFQNFLQHAQMGAVQAAQAQMVTQQRAVPRYLQNAVQTAQQQQFNTTGFFNRR